MLETELQNKVKSLNEHQSKVDKMEEELMEIARKQKHIFHLELDGDENSDKKLLLAKRSQEQLQEIFRRKQSLSLNLKPALPASPGDGSSSGDEVIRNGDIKSNQDAYNRKRQIATALSLVPQSIPSSIDTAETFHTAAADSPELRMAFAEDITKESNNSLACQDTSIHAQDTSAQLDSPDSDQDRSSETNSKDSLNYSRKTSTENASRQNKINGSTTNGIKDDSKSATNSTTEEEILQDSLESPVQQNPEMKRLNQRIVRQRMMVMRCLEANTPSKDELNRQISVLQDLQKQQIELEVALLEEDRKNRSKPECTDDRLVVSVQEDYDGSKHECNIESSTSSATLLAVVTRRSPLFMKNRPNDEEEYLSESVAPRLSSGRGYSTVYLTSQNRGDRLSSPYSLTITRSLPSLITNDGGYDSVINVIVSVPSYVIRGAGTSSHYEYEVRVVAQDDSWSLLRRYRRFRELYISMRQKYGSKVAAIRFPPRQVFPRYEVVARQRRKRLEEYLRKLIQVCSELPHCEPLYKYNGNLSNIDKQSLLEFSSFFRRGTFESSKYGTS